MTRSAPSISTTGAAGDSSSAEVGEQVGLAGGLQLLGALVAPDFREDVDGGRHIGCGRVVANPVYVQPVASRRDLRDFLELPYRLHSSSEVWVPPLRIERRLFLNRRLNAFFKHGKAQEFIARRDGRVIGRITAQFDESFNEFHDNRWGMFGFLEFEDDPDVVPAMLEAAAALAALPRPRPHDRPDGLHDQRRERRDDRGLRARADDQAALAPALLPAALRGGRADQGDGPPDVGARHLRPRAHAADHLQARRADRGAPRRASCARCRGARCGATWTASPTSTTRPGARTGASPRTRRRTSTTTPRRCSSSSTRTGSWSPRRRRARRWPWRSPCPTSTRCSRR